MEDGLTKPKILVAVFTGPPKRYALLDMVASVKNLDYSNYDVLFSVTMRPDYDSEGFLSEVKAMLSYLPEKVKWEVATTPTPPEDLYVTYKVAVSNRQTVRSRFLDGDYDYLLLCGGDNPPSRDAIKRLLKLDADAALGVSWERPGKMIKVNPSDSDQMLRVRKSHPMLWSLLWTPDDIYGKYPELEPKVREAIKRTFISSTFVMPFTADPNWRKYKVATNLVGGDGVALYSRNFLERIGWSMPTWSKHSEDIHALVEAHEMGLKVVTDLKYHVRHLNEDGSEI
jgi:hypothetical protein